MLGGHVIFCDDIRQEVGGQATYVGRYQASINLEGTLPAFLPKLALVVIWSQTIDEELLPVDWRLMVPGDPEPRALGKFDLTTVTITQSDLDPSERLLTMEVHVVMMPFEIREAGDLRVIATRGGKTIHLRRIMIVVAKPADVEPEQSV